MEHLPPKLFEDPPPEPDTDEAGSEDEELPQVAAALHRLDLDGTRIARVLRETIDQLLDGQRTGRWDWKDLRKTEKTHMGTLVEINLHREFDFEDGDAMDYRIAGIEVDCKFSQRRGGWQIPVEAVGHVCLLMWADDEPSLWSAGLVRPDDQILRGANRDQKRTLGEEGIRRIRWLWRDQQLPENLLRHLDPDTRARIFSFPGRRNGQRRVDELFRLIQGRLVSRTAVLTAGQQDDPVKRTRDSRIHLRPEGIVILGAQGDHPRIARALDLPLPRKGEWVSVRIVQCERDGESPRVTIDGVHYRTALEADPPEPAPLIDSRREQT